MATLETLRSRVRNSVDDQGLESTYVDQKLRESLRRVTPYLKLLTRASIPIAAGQIAYQLPSDFFKLVFIAIGGTMLYTRDGDYEIIGTTVIIDEREPGDDIVVTYYRNPIPWVADAEPDGVPDEWCDMLEKYAVAEILMREEGLEEHFAMKSAFNERLAEFAPWATKTRSYKVQRLVMR